jgi:hypothetical protein
MGNKSSTGSYDVSTDSCDVSTKYHTVEVGKNLPKVEQNYPCSKAENLPPADYWMQQMKGIWFKKYKEVQHIMANGPRESLKNFYSALCFFVSRYIVMQ